MPEKRLVEAADLFRLRYVTSAQLSPDGKQAAYTVSWIEGEKDKESEHSAIWLLGLESGETRQLTSGTAKDGSPTWSPDGKQIAFLSTRGEKPQIYVIAVDGGEARAVTSLKQGVGSGAAWSPDGKQIAFTAVPIEEPRDPSKPYRVDRHVYRFNEMEYLDDVAQALYISSIDSGEARRLTHDRTMSVQPEWSPDGTEILYISLMQPDRHDAVSQELFAVHVESGATRDLLGGWGKVGIAAWTPDGKRIVFSGQPDGLLIGSKDDLWVIEREGGTPICRTESLAVGVGGGLQGDMPISLAETALKVSADGTSVYAAAQDGGTIGIYKVALDGAETWEKVIGGERSCLLYGASESTLVYGVSDFNHPIDIFACDADGSNERQLTRINDEWLAQVKLPAVEHLLFAGSDGAQVEGWLVTPPEGNAPYPTILYIHGGPHSAFGHIFHFDTQMLCGAGYAVLLINHRASMGYGNGFSTVIKGDWGNLDYNDLMAGVDFVIGKGWTDAERMGVCGLSGGGNLSCWIVGQTDRFKAAVPENPVTNWVSFYGVSDIGVWFAVEELGGHPHEIPEIYARCSPITYAHRCKTPTLLMQGEHDWRCPPEQSEQFYATLKANGCTVEMMRFPGASHASTLRGALPVRTAHNDALLGWMNRYVLGQTE